jgi:hypothetical protein
MKTRLSWPLGISLLAGIALLGAVAFRPPAEAQRKIVVVELFTSEGCSSCPPADELLTRLGREHTSNGAEIIPLGFHVDYWDHQGWRDRFSSRAYTERQEKYATRFRLDGPYTPQMVVDGGAQFVGNDPGRAEAVILQATAQPQAADVQLSWAAANKLQVRVTARENNASGEVRLAITEDNLSNNVAAGENGGRVLHHSAVVRDFRLLGQLADGKFQMEVPLQLKREWKVEDLRVVVFVEHSNSRIEGAASLRLPAS